MNRLMLSREDFSDWLKVATLFLAPVAVIYFSYVIGNMDDGFQWSDFIPNLFVQGAIVAYFLNEVLAYFKKLTKV